MGKEKDSAQKTTDTIRRKTRRKHSAKERIRIVMRDCKVKRPSLSYVAEKGVRRS